MQNSNVFHHQQHFQAALERLVGHQVDLKLDIVYPTIDL